MLIREFWEVYNKYYKKFESPGFQVLNHPLGGDTGYYLCSIYVNEKGKYCIDRTQKRSNSPYHHEYDSEEVAVEHILNICSSITGYKL